MSTESGFRKKALVLIWIGEVWNVFEATIAIWAALLAGSVALMAFGLDSLIELFAGAVMIWRFWKERKDKEGKTKNTSTTFQAEINRYKKSYGCSDLRFRVILCLMIRKPARYRSYNLASFTPTF